MKILIIEDEKKLVEALKIILKKHNFIIDCAYDGEFGLDCALTDIYDIIVLDIMIPKINGLDVLKKIRLGNINTPIILLTALSQTEDKIFGLDSGADDYLTKPFETEELLARIRALTRRKSKIMVDDNITFEDLRLNKNNFQLYSKNKNFKLTVKEFNLMEMLISNKEQIISKNQIIEKLWGFNSNAEDNHVEVYISFLRKKINSMDSIVCIETIKGLGYILTKK